MAETPTGIDFKKFPVLLVDDEKGFLRTFLNQFSDYFTIFTAENAEEGLKLIKEHPDIALVLADQRMPGVTGVQLLGELRDKRPEITRVLITGYSDIEAAIDAINIGDVFRYISKPYKFEEVKEILERGIDRFVFFKQRRRPDEEEIERLRKDIDKESLERLNALSFGLSHHFRNRLSAAVTFFEILPEKLQSLVGQYARGLDKDYWHNFSEKAEQGIKNVMELISDLYSFLTVGNYVFEKKDIGRLIDSEKDVFKSLAQGKEIRFQYDLPRELSASIDALRLKQALENIVLNAVQAIPEKGEVTVKAEQEKGALKITVTDTGRGIQRENLKKIFYPFFTTKDPQIKGLGLTIADAIIRHHLGQIEIQSKPDQGTSVVIHLPLERDEAFKKES